MTNFADIFFTKETSALFNLTLLGDDSSIDSLAIINYAKAFFSLLNIHDEDEAIIVDVGCGPGHFGLALARYLKKGKIIFLDCSLQMLNIAKENVRGKLVNSRIKTEFILGNAENFDDLIGNVSVDGIFSRHVVHLISNPSHFLKGAYKHLKPGGKLLFSLIGHNTYNFGNNRRKENAILINGFFSRLYQATKYYFPSILVKLSKDKLKSLIVQGVLRIERDGQIYLSNDALLPSLDKASIFKQIEKTGIPLPAVTYLMLSEIHTVYFKKKFSLYYGSIPLPGIWDIFNLLEPLTQAVLVDRIYNRAFPGDQLQPIYTEDPIFIITKKGRFG